MSQEKEILAFARHTYGHRSLEGVAVKFAEEAGEVAGAIFEITENRIGNLDHLRAEIGDALFVLAQLCALAETTLQAELDNALKKNIERAMEKAKPDPPQPAPFTKATGYWKCDDCGCCAKAINEDTARSILRHDFPRCSHNPITPYQP